MTMNWVGWIVSGVVLLLLFAAGAILKNPVRLLITGERTEGIVVGMAESGSLQAPMVEFVTSTGERVSVKGRSYSASPSARVGDTITVAYDPSYPKDTQILSLGEFPLVPAGVVLGFTALIILLWVSAILISGDSALGDPLHLLPTIISRFRLNPVRFPIIFMLSVVIPVCGIGTYVTSRHALDMRSNGIKAVGHVIGFQEKKVKRFRSMKTRTAHYSEIAFEDVSGTAHTILGGEKDVLLSPPKIGDVVEVIYLASHPDQGRVNTWGNLYLYPLFLGPVTLASLVLLGLVLNGTIAPSASEPGSQRKLKTSGVPAVATVIEANPEAQLLHYRIDKDTRIPTANLDDFDSFELTLGIWKPSQADAKLKKGDQFRAYLDSRKPSKNFYVDLNDKIGYDPLVKSIEEEEGDTPLHKAANRGNKDVVELLLTKGADVNAKNTEGVTPLHWAALQGEKYVAELLLARGADVNVKDTDGRTPLHWAEELGSQDIAKLLLAKGADANAKDNDGKTPAELSGVSGK